jgi:hypothetical protein
MIETGVDVMEGGSLSFQEVGVDFVRYPPAFELLNWDADQRLLLIRIGTEVGPHIFGPKNTRRSRRLKKLDGRKFKRSRRSSTPPPFGC